VAFHPNPFFVGRDLLLAELQTRLKTPNLTTRRVTLTGLGGIGKTSVVVEYVYRQHAAYDLVWWVNGEQPASLLADLAALAGQLRLVTDAPQEAQVAALRGWLERHQRWLLVLDNVDDPEAVVELLPRGATGHVVLTSRTGVGWERLTSVLPVDVLAPGDAADLLLTRADETGPVAEAAAATLAESLDGLPLALEQAGAYVASTGTVGLAGYAELFATRALELLGRGQPLGYQHTVATTWSLALARLRETEPAAVDLLTLMSFLAPDDLPQPLLAGHHEQLPEPLTAAAGDPLALSDAVAALRRFSLVRVVADGLFVHRLLQTVVRANLEAEVERAWAAAAIRVLRAGFPYESNEVDNWPECQRLLPHVFAVVDHGRRLDVEATAWLWLLHQMAVFMRSRGQYRQALPLHEQAVAGRRRVLGDDHPDTLISMSNLALARRALGDLHGACDLFEQVLTTRRRVLGDDYPDTLRSMNSLAVTRLNLGDPHGAHDLFEQTLAVRRRVLGDDHPDTLWTMHSLAVTRGALGDLRGARELHEQALAGFRRVLGDDHPNTLRSMYSLAVIRRALGDLQSARDLFEQVLADSRRVLGDDHPDTLRTMNKLATTRRDLGDRQGARGLVEQALADSRRVLGDDHPDTLILVDNLAGIHRDLGDVQGARHLFEQALAGLRRVFGDDHPDTLRSMNNLAAVRRELEEP
jgi:tetratricopeptide (TPR) repeat protein